MRREAGKPVSEGLKWQPLPEHIHSEKNGQKQMVKSRHGSDGRGRRSPGDPWSLRGLPLPSAKFIWEVSAKYAGTLQKKGFPNFYRFCWEPYVHGSFCQMYVVDQKYVVPSTINPSSSFKSFNWSATPYQSLLLISLYITDFYICACLRCLRLSSLLSLSLLIPELELLMEAPGVT